MTKLVAILNITPDSFSDAGKYNNLNSAISYLKQLIEQSADIIDIGAESTRPGANPVTYEEEWERLKTILPEAIDYIKSYNKQNNKNILISLDSRHYKTVKKALELGIDIINDVSGFEDPKMIELAARSGKKIIVMHNLGIPADKNKIVPKNLDVIQVIIDWMKNKLEKLTDSDVKKEQIIFDPGIGFGKDAEQSINILNNIDKLRILDLPLFIGHSKKSFLSNFIPESHLNIADIADKTLIISKYLAEKQVEYLRVHDVAKNKTVL